MKLEKEVKKLRKIVNDLRQIIHKQSIEIMDLHKENNRLLKRIAELEGTVKEKSKPFFIKDSVETKPLKTGQKKGHEGNSRCKPENIDETKVIDCDECPDCSGKLSGVQEVRSRIITDIEINIVNREYLIHRRYCKCCKKMVEARITDALPNARYSLKLMLLIMMLKAGLRMPSKRIVDFFNLFSLQISDGEIYNVLDRLKLAFADYYCVLVEKMREARKKHIDESSWRIGGKNHWIWIFINEEIALFEIQKSRGSKVPIEVLGNQDGKTFTTDRFSAYNVLVSETGGTQQVCWTHLIRNTKDLSEFRTEAKYIHKRLKYIYRKAREGKTPKEKLLQWIDLIKSRHYKSTEVNKFIRSVCKNHRDDLFRFVDDPCIEPTNNLAERGLRHAVVIRKISGGSRSKKGADTTAKLLSVMQTIRMKEGNPINNMMHLLQKPK